MQRLTSLSFAHPAVSSDRRARLFVPGPLVPEAHSRLRSGSHHAFLLSTCLRVEIAWTGAPDAASEILICLYGDPSLADLAAVRSDEDAFVHLSRVAAGLESPLIGEAEVLIQFREAVALLQRSGPAQRDLQKVLDAAVGIGKTTRRLLADTPQGSLGRLAAQLVTPGTPVAILGAGAMARAAADQLHGIEVTVFARRGGTHGPATEPWELAAGALATFPTVISTVPGNGPLFSDEAIVDALGSRDAPLLLIDLGMPPGFQGLHAEPAVRYLGVDEVASSATSSASMEKDDQVSRGASAIWRRFSAPERVGAVIAALIDQSDATVSEEVARFARRLPAANDPEAILRQLAHSVARRILHRPISYMGSTERGGEVAEAVAEAFGIGDD